MRSGLNTQKVTRHADMFAALGAEPRLRLVRLLLTAHPRGLVAGDIGCIPLPDNSVDVIISNCVINLYADKDQVLRKAFRMLKPGGRFAVSGIVVRGPVPAVIRRSVQMWVGWVAGGSRNTNTDPHSPRRDLKSSASSRLGFTMLRMRGRCSPVRGAMWMRLRPQSMASS